MGWTAGVLVVMAMLACRLSAVPQQLMYPYGPQHGDRSLPPSDDFSSDEIELDIPVVFFDTAFQSIYVRILEFRTYLLWCLHVAGYVYIYLWLKMHESFLRTIYSTNRLFPSKHSFATRGLSQHKKAYCTAWTNLGHRNNKFEIDIITSGVDLHNIERTDLLKNL